MCCDYLILHSPIDLECSCECCSTFTSASLDELLRKLRIQIYNYLWKTGLNDLYNRFLWCEAGKTELLGDIFIFYKELKNN